MKKTLIIYFVLLCGLVLMACGSENVIQGENYGDITATDAGLVVTRADHTTGWGKSTCFDCHQINNIHQNDRSGTGLNLDAIRYMTETQGLASCVTCHGTNGVP